MMSVIQLNGEQQSALDAMMAGRNVFLTGEAGTGKSTVLREFRRQCNRACAVLAPTGVAAINVGGSTIHSFFMLKPGLMTEDTIDEIGSGKKRAVIRATKTIIIDEISMVRSDVFAAIDIRLRSLARGGNREKPFGGKQMILVGDFFQLPPVVKTETESEFLKREYGGDYAFLTGLWERAGFRSVFLKTIHRQKSDTKFLSVLNNIRNGELDAQTIQDDGGAMLSAVEVLNRHCLDKPDMPCQPVSLCTTNREAHAINAMARARLKDAGAKFNAVVSGKFPEGDFPTEAQLELMPGARVMLLCNKRLPDGSFEYVNGDMGQVLELSPGTNTPWVKIRLDRGNEVKVSCNEWKNYTYVLEEDRMSGKKTLRQKEVGKFVQLPIRLAYAITIHKSQGLSLDYVDLKLGSGCFTHGQLYTALSRCRTLEGLRLDRTVMKEDLILDPAVVSFYKSLNTPKSKSNSVPINVPPEYEAAIRAYLAQLQGKGTPSREPPSILDISCESRSLPVSNQAQIEECVESHIDIKKLMIVYGGQTGEERSEGATIKDNGKGFNKFDAPILTPIAEEYKSQGWITRSQLEEVSHRIQKYHAQWEGKI